MAEALKKAQALLDEAKISDAEAAAKQAVESYTAAKDDTGLAQALSTHIYIKAVQDKRKEAKLIAKEELARFREANSKIGEAWMLYALARVYSERMGDHGREVAAKSATDALALFRELGDKKMQAECLLERAFVHIKVMDKTLPSYPEKRATEAESCISVAEEAIALCKELGDPVTEAKAQSMIMTAKVHGDMGDWEDVGAAASQKLKEGGSMRNVAANTYLMASMYFKKQMYEDAVKSAKNAVELWKDIPDDMGYVSASYGMLIEALVKAEELQEATGVCNDALEYFQGKQDKQGEAMIHSAKILLKFTEKEVDEAEVEFDEALKIIRTLDADGPGIRPKRWEAELLHEMAKMQSNSDNHSKALEFALKSLRIYQKLKDAQAAGDVNQTICFIHLADLDKDGKVKNSKDAVKAAYSMRKAFKVAGDTANMGVACLTANQAYASKGNAKDALKAATEAVALFQKAEDPKREAYAYILMAWAHNALDKISDATKAADNALTIYREINDKAGESEALDVIFKIEHPVIDEKKDGVAEAESKAEAEATAASGGTIASFVQLDFDSVGKAILEGAKQVVTEESLELDTPLMDAGMDSLTSVAFRNGLMSGFGGMNLPATLTFDFPTVRQITDHIVERSQYEEIAVTMG